MSGARADRRRLAKAIEALQAGDVLLVTRLDRLARSTRDLLNVLDAVAQRQAGFKSIADPMIDTTSPHGKLILAVLGALAEFERSMILSRTAKDALGLRLVVLDLVANRNSRHSKSARPWADAKPV